MRVLQALKTIAVGTALLGTPRSVIAAQQVIDLTSVSICTQCTLETRVLAQLGTQDGEGIIESQAAQVRYNAATRQYAVFQIGGTRILLFDDSGRFIRGVGRMGPGPGEFGGLTDVQISDSLLIAVDRDGPSIVVLNHAGDVRYERRLTVRRGRFRIASDTTIVVASRDRSPQSVGYPLHLVHIRTGEPLKNFGSRDGQGRLADQYAMNPIIGFSVAPERFWEANNTPFLLEEWDTSNRLGRTITARGSYFVEEGAAAANQPPPTLLESFGIDGNERLWTITLVPDRRWREAPRHGNEGYVLERDVSLLRDVRIDLYDLRSKRHLGTLRWDESLVGLVQVGDELAVQRVEIRNDVPQVVVYRLTPERFR